MLYNPHHVYCCGANINPNTNQFGSCCLIYLPVIFLFNRASLIGIELSRINCFWIWIWINGLHSSCLVLCYL